MVSPDKLSNNFKDKKKHLVYAKDLLEEKNLEYVLNDIEDKLNNLDIIIHCLGGSFGINDPLDTWKKFEISLRGNLGVSVDINKKFKLSTLLPKTKEFYAYNGSLTTPPCSEGVKWIVMKDVLEVSKKQIEMFKKSVGLEKTNRPIQQQK